MLFFLVNFTFYTIKTILLHHQSIFVLHLLHQNIFKSVKNEATFFRGGE